MVAMSTDIATSAAATTIEEKSAFELLLFRGKEAYVYQIPPAGTVSGGCEPLDLPPTWSKAFCGVAHLLI